MDASERKQVDMLRSSVGARIEAMAAACWNDRRTAAAELLAAVNAAWWRVHERDPAAYRRDLNRLNCLAGWTGDNAQVGEWHGPRGQIFLMPPKFFGGNPLALEEKFVASVSLNHAVLPGDSADFAQELGDQQSQDAAFAAHRDYFMRPYAYSRFFRPRAQVLHAYAMAIHAAAVPPATDWRAVNNRYALYIELLPTRSKRFRGLAREVDFDALVASVFVAALNAVAHDVLLRLLRPQRVLLAGKETWQAWPDPGVTPMGTDVGRHLRPIGRCPVYVTNTRSAFSGHPVILVRTNFLRTVYGPNSNDELASLGRDVLAQDGSQCE